MSGSAEHSPHAPDQGRIRIPPRTIVRGLLTGEGHVANYFVVPPDSYSLREKPVNSYGRAALVVSSGLPDRPSTDPDGTPKTTQSSAMNEFLRKRDESERERAERKGVSIPFTVKQSSLTTEEVMQSLELQRFIDQALHPADEQID